MRTLFTVHGRMGLFVIGESKRTFYLRDLGEVICHDRIGYVICIKEGARCVVRIVKDGKEQV